jgi:hypothetical protein
MDQRGLASPGYMTGGAASNKLAALFGIAPQDYQAAYGGGFSGGGMSGGSQMLPNLGAGQPVQGRSGGGGSNAAAGAVGSIAGTFLGGPLGSAVGGALGGMIRDGGDNWKTVATQAPGGFDYAAYMQQPDLQAEWAKPDIKALFGGNQDAYANWHFNQFGKNEGRTLAPMGGEKTNMPVGDAQMAGQSGGAMGGPSNPLAEFYASPYAKLATTISDGQFDQIKGNLGAAGKSISGAAEGRYAKTLAGNTYGAFGDYTNQLANLAGMGQTSSQLASNAAGNYGVNAGNAMMKAGDARANALSSAYKGYGTGISDAVGGIVDYGNKNKWWTT